MLWLRDPSAWVLGAAAAGSSRLLAFADVVVSTDVTSGANDNDAQQWGVLQEMNTGMLLLQSSAGAMALCRSWVERMQLEMVSIAKLPPAMLQWCVERPDLLQRGRPPRAPARRPRRPPPPSAPKRGAPARDGGGGAAPPSELEESLTALEALRTAPGAQRAAAGGTYADARGVMIKRYARGSAEQVFSIATFPFELFASGHTYFTQSLQPRRGFVPVAVHTTFQFGDTAEFAWGKRSRLRERLLWKVDKDDYFTRSGGGDHPSEAEYRGFLHLAGDMRAFTEWMANGSLIRSEAAASVKLEGRPAFIENGALKRVAATREDAARGQPEPPLAPRLLPAPPGPRGDGAGPRDEAQGDHAAALLLVRPLLEQPRARPLPRRSGAAAAPFPPGARSAI